MQARGASKALQVAVVEDDDILREEVMLPELRDHGFVAQGFGSVEELYRNMLGQHFDLVVLDIALPGESGLHAAAHLREIQPRLGIVVMTGVAGYSNQVRAMREGADAYLSKPIETEVLAATLHSLARRMRLGEGDSAHASLGQQTTGKWRLSADGWHLMSPDGRTAALTPPERCVMLLLAVATGEPVTRERLNAALAADITEFDPHRLDMIIHRVRRKAHALIDGTGSMPLPLVAIRGIGYVLSL